MVTTEKSLVRPDGLSRKPQNFDRAPAYERRRNQRNSEQREVVKQGVVKMKISRSV